MCILESLLLKTPQIWPISDPTPTLTGVSNQKTSVFASEYTKTNSPKVVLKGTNRCFFVSKKDAKNPLKTHPNLQIQKENKKKLNEIRK